MLCLEVHCVVLILAHTEYGGGTTAVLVMYSVQKGGR
jgi:hypothetical protein